MKIWHDHTYMTASDNLWIARGYACEDLHSLRLQFVYTDHEREENSEFSATHNAAEQKRHRIQCSLSRSNAMAPIMGAIAEHFCCYQYRHDDPVSFESDRWDLFFWCNSFAEAIPGIEMPDRDYAYFTLNFNTNQTVEKRAEICQRVLAFLQERFKNEAHLDVAVQYTVFWDHAKIHADVEKVKGSLVGRHYSYGLKPGTLFLQDGYLCFKASHVRQWFYKLKPTEILELSFQLGLLADQGKLE